MEYISIALTIIATLLAIKAASIKIPDSPKRGDSVAAEPFQKLFKAIQDAGKLNNYAGLFIILSIIFQLISKY